MGTKRFPWKDEYNLGIEDIDYQHHYFLNLINRMSDELGVMDHPDQYAPLIAELNAYARFHFISEENLMRKFDYPELGAHRQHHIDLVQELNQREAMLSMESSCERAEEIIEFLFVWFIQHTTGEDRQFADHYHRVVPAD